MKCYLCGSENQIKRRGKPRDNKSINVLECLDCRLVFLDSFNHISDKYYEESQMNKENFQPKSVNAWLKETEIDDIRRLEKHKSKLNGKEILDFGCGAGGFLRAGRNLAKKVKGVELDQKVKEHWNGIIDIASSLEEIIEKKETFDTITLFHVLEHIKDPINTLKDISKCIKNNGEIIIEVPCSEDALLTLYECEAFQNFSYWSNHLFLFNNDNLGKIIEKSGLKVKFIENYQRYSLSNHLYWLSQGKPNGHNIWSFLNTKSLSYEYSEALKKIKKTDTLIAYACI